MNPNDRKNYSHLDESLIAVPVDTALPSTQATPMMEVVAPANLPEGYTFPVEIPNQNNNNNNNNPRTFTVTVPKGGIEEGQSFSVPLPGGSDTIDDSLIMPRVSIPVGHWKDGMFDCCTYGCFHPLLWNAMCCVPIATAQVASRLHLNWYGRPAESNQTTTTGTFQKILYGVISYWCIDRFLLFLMFGSVFSDSQAARADDEEYYQVSSFVIFLSVTRKLLRYAYFIYMVIFLKNTREYVRQKYAIPEHDYCVHGCEDVCCSIFCACCTVSQMARHTTDYETYRGVCCSETGLPPHVPAIV